MRGPDSSSGSAPASGLASALARVPAHLRSNPYRTAAAAVAALGGFVVLVLATQLFPYHSSNHDEGVYLLQASMLLEGRFELQAGALSDSFRPWFFVQDGGRLYPKYAPVPAAVFAIGTVLGEPRISLALVAAGNVALVYALAAAAWDRRTGVLAAVALAGSPLFLLPSSVFLPYAPTTFFNLAFAFAYVRTVRRRSAGYAALSGGAIGLAFFGRPYTAVLFAAPFILHALWELADGYRRHGAGPRSSAADPSSSAHPPESELRSRTVVLGTVAAIGALGVVAALLYNRAVTESALLFPYEAFAPADGPGFGRREILDHSVEYTPGLAVRSNAHLLWYLATRWTVLGPIGAALALVGVAAHVRGPRPAAPADLDGTTLRWLFVGVACSVVAGNLFFWGNYNLLATIDDPTDGLVALFGPFYHFDLLLPISGFAAAGVVALSDRVRSRLEHVAGRTAATVADPTGSRAARILLVVVLVSSLPAAVSVQAAVLGPPIERNAAYTAYYEEAYAPFGDVATSPLADSAGGSDGADLENALVFLPTPYGDWLGHPFQPLRNDPDLAGEQVYALDRGPASNWAVIDAYSDRDVYRYAYRGEWTPDPSERVEPLLEPLDTRSGERLTADVTVGVPANVERASVTVTGGDERRAFDLSDAGDREEIALEWTIGPNGTSAAKATGPRDDANASGATNHSTGSIALPEEGTVSLLVTLTQPGGATLTYRLDLTVRSDGTGVEVLWPAERKVCTLATDCGSEGTYLPDRPDAHLEDVSMDATLEEEEEEEEEEG